MSAPAPLNRRRFGALLAGAAVAAAQPATALAGAHTTRGGKAMKQHLLKPTRLHSGDLVGIVAPAGPSNPAAIEQAVQNLQALGLRAKLGAHLGEVYGNYGGSVEHRVADLHAMFLDPEVKAVWAIRGGSGCIALLSHLNYKLIRSNPKILLGFSDVTALHLALQRRAGLVSFHGPVLSSPFSDYTRNHLQNLLMAPQAHYTIPMAEENRARAVAAPQYALRTVHAGQASGRLMGGNLSMVAALAGTPYAADFRQAIVFLEDVGEEPYRIDRMMTQLQLSEGFEHAAAMMLGVFEKCAPAADEVSLSLEQTLDQHLLPLKLPAATGYSFGHIRDQFTLPLGLLARLDTEQQTLTLLEPAVL